MLAFFAAITSSIALLETSTKWVDEQSAGDNRVMSAAGIGFVIFLIGVLNALSQVPTVGLDGQPQETFWNTWQPLGGIALFEGMVLLDFLSGYHGYHPAALRVCGRRLRRLGRHRLDRPRGYRV